MEGPAFKEYPEFRGNYEFMYTSSKYGDVYENTIGSEWYLFNSTNGYWEIGKVVSKSTKNIYHRTCDAPCPSKCSSDWLYWNRAKNTWKVDKLIKITCQKLKCCTSLKLYSNGKSKNQWSESFGVYRYMEKDIKGGNIYGHIKSKRYIVRDHKANFWKVADGYGKSKSYYLSRYHTDGYFCPEDAAKDNWKYYDNDRGEWIEDRSIHLTCEHN